MKSKMFQFLGIIFIFFSIGCSSKLSPFTEGLRKEQGWSEDEIEQIQFYLSDDIVLRRQIRSGTSEIVSGEIKIVDGRKVEEIIISEGTPGILVKYPKSNRLGISFEESHDERFLMFGPNPKKGNRYMLLAAGWDRKKGEITYDGRKYYTSIDSGALSTLLVDLKKIKKTKVNSRKAKGRTID